MDEKVKFLPMNYKTYKKHYNETYKSAVSNGI